MTTLIAKLLVLLILSASSLFAQIRLEIFRGSQILPFIPELTKISLIANKDEVCLVGMGDDPAFYLTQYTQSVAAIACLAYQDCKIVGFTIGAPLSACVLFFPRFFFLPDRFDAARLFYIGEISLLPGYRKGNIGRGMLQLVEKVVRQEQIYSGFFLMSLDNRYGDRELRPWENFGYQRYDQRLGVGQATYDGFVRWVKAIEDQGVPNLMWESQFAIPNRYGMIDYY